LKKGSFSFENTPEDAKNLWLSKSDSVYAYIEWIKTGGALIENKEGRFPVEELYRYYTRYCDKHDRDPVDPRMFTIKLKKFGFTIKRPKNIATLYGYILRKDILEKMLEESEI
jgi:phage/plasmid-associated DNA primase